MEAAKEEAEAAREEAEAARKEAEAAREEAEAALQSVLDGTKQLTVRQLCKMLLTDAQYRAIENIPSLDAMGRRKERVEDMGGLSKQRLKRVLEPLLKSVCARLKAGAPDPEGVLNLFLEQNDGVLNQLQGKKSPLEHPVCNAIRLGMTAAVQMGQYNVATQLLSLVTASMGSMDVTYPEVEAFFTSLCPLEVGMPA